MTANRTYLILDSQNHALANSELASPPGASPIRLNILNNKVDDVMSHEIITLFSSSSEDLQIGRASCRERV